MNEININISKDEFNLLCIILSRLLIEIFDLKKKYGENYFSQAEEDYLKLSGLIEKIKLNNNYWYKKIKKERIK
jgi:hypothetical protein